MAGFVAIGHAPGATPLQVPCSRSLQGCDTVRCRSLHVPHPRWQTLYGQVAALDARFARSRMSILGDLAIILCTPEARVATPAMSLPPSCTQELHELEFVPNLLAVNRMGAGSEIALGTVYSSGKLL